jgi:hypothetical protein
METEMVRANKLKTGDRVKEIKTILTVVSSEPHATHKRYQVLKLQYPQNEEWQGYIAEREVGQIARYERLID